jgi:hypothetical protein
VEPSPPPPPAPTPPPPPLPPSPPRRSRVEAAIVTPRFKGKSECIEYMCIRIKLHTCIDSVNTKTQCKSV